MLKLGQKIEVEKSDYNKSFSKIWIAKSILDKGKYILFGKTETEWKIITLGKLKDCREKAKEFIEKEA